SESFRISQKPSNPTIVVLGVNSSLVSLEWRYSDAPPNYYVQFLREKPRETVEIISSSKDRNAFEPSSTKEFEASLEATLKLKNVKRNEEYTYTIFLLDTKLQSQGSHAVSIIVVVFSSVVIRWLNSCLPIFIYNILSIITLPLMWQFLRCVCNILYHVIVVIISHNLNAYLKLLFPVPPEITDPPEPRPFLTIGKNYTLTCNASGDPLPKITWTKDGIPAEEFNVTGYKLHLTDMKLKDVGSYRCTASNGYGVDASNASIVGVKCNECEIKTVGIKLESETWKSALNNRESIEFKTLQANLLSEISKVYTKSPGKELYTVGVVDFRSGSVIAKVEMKFGKSVTDPLKPLEDEIKEGKLGAFSVKRELDLNPRAPDVVEIDELPGETTNDTITLKWKEPESNGKVIIMYTVYLRVVTDGKVGQWTEIRRIRDVSVRELKIALERGKVYQFAITAT
ncbi:unnamed protein product, partial [Pocillopora meandrina]